MTTDSASYPTSTRTAFGIHIVGLLFTFTSCTGNGVTPSSPEAKDTTGIWSRIAEIFITEIENCPELYSWMQKEGAELTCTGRNEKIGMRLRYVPSAVRYCMAPKDAFGLGLRTPHEVIKLGKATTQYILEMHWLSESTTADKQPVRLSKEDVLEVIGFDTMQCAFAHHEPRIPAMRNQRVVLGFDHPESTLDRTIIVLDHDSTHGGEISLRFKAGVFRQYQALNLDNTLVQWGE